MSDTSCSAPASTDCAQLAARDAQQAATAYTTAGIQGIANAAAQTIASAAPLYSKTNLYSSQEGILFKILTLILDIIKIQSLHT